jgi:hypothetical protein
MGQIMISMWSTKKTGKTEVAYTKRTRVYNYSELDGYEAVALCNKLMLKPALVNGKYEHPNKVTIEYHSCYEFDTFYVVSEGQE